MNSDCLREWCGKLIRVTYSKRSLWIKGPQQAEHRQLQVARNGGGGQLRKSYQGTFTTLLAERSPRRILRHVRTIAAATVRRQSTKTREQEKEDPRVQEKEDPRAQGSGHRILSWLLLRTPKKGRGREASYTHIGKGWGVDQAPNEQNGRNASRRAHATGGLNINLPAWMHLNFGDSKARRHRNGVSPPRAPRSWNRTEGLAQFMMLTPISWPFLSASGIPHPRGLALAGPRSHLARAKESPVATAAPRYPPIPRGRHMTRYNHTPRYRGLLN